MFAIYSKPKAGPMNGDEVFALMREWFAQNGILR
jgi:hypothetical protein